VPARRARAAKVRIHAPAASAPAGAGVTWGKARGADAELVHLLECSEVRHLRTFSYRLPAGTCRCAILSSTGPDQPAMGRGDAAARGAPPHHQHCPPRPPRPPPRLPPRRAPVSLATRLPRPPQRLLLPASSTAFPACLPILLRPPPSSFSSSSFFVVLFILLLLLLLLLFVLLPASSSSSSSSSVALMTSFKGLAYEPVAEN